MRALACVAVALAMTGPAAAETVTLYAAPVERLVDRETGAVAFLPG